MQLWIILCILFELLSELKMSEKYKSHFAFLTGIIAVAIILGSLVARLGDGTVSLQENVLKELQKWQVYVESYEISDEMKRQLMEAEELYEEELMGEGMASLQESLQNIMEKYGCTLADAVYDEKDNKVRLTVKKGKSGKIEIGKITLGESEEEAEQKIIRQEIEEFFEERGERVEVDVIFQES